MERYCTVGSEGSIQDSVQMELVKLKNAGVQLELPEGFHQMQEEKVRRCYPWEERPDIILENSSGVQITAQMIRQKMQAAQIHWAVEGIQKMTESLFPQYRVSPVYICGKGKLPVGWFHMGMPDKGAEHIKAIGIMSDYMAMLTFTYPAEAAVKWKSILRHSFGTWREYCGED